MNYLTIRPLSNSPRCRNDVGFCLSLYASSARLHFLSDHPQPTAPPRVDFIRICFLTTRELAAIFAVSLRVLGHFIQPSAGWFYGAASAVLISLSACANVQTSWTTAALCRFFTLGECESARGLAQSKTRRQFGSFSKNSWPQKLVRIRLGIPGFRLLISGFWLWPQGIRDGLRQFLPERRRFNLPRIARI